MLRFEATQLVLRHAGDRPIVSNLGPTTDELWHAGHRDRNFYTYGNMGLCSSIALGMAVSTDEQVISLDGDGSLLMNLGTVATIGREQPRNLIVIVWDNEQWGQTGHQASHTAHGTDLEQVARNCGIRNTETVRDLESLESAMLTALDQEGPWFIVAKIQEAEYLPVAPIEPEMTLYRFRNSFVPPQQPFHPPASRPAPAPAGQRGNENERCRRFFRPLLDDLRAAGWRRANPSPIQSAEHRLFDSGVPGVTFGLRTATDADTNPAVFLWVTTYTMPTGGDYEYSIRILDALRQDSARIEAALGVDTDSEAALYDWRQPGRVGRFSFGVRWMRPEEANALTDDEIRAWMADYLTRFGQAFSQSRLQTLLDETSDDGSGNDV